MIIMMIIITFYYIYSYIYIYVYINFNTYITYDLGNNNFTITDQIGNFNISNPTLMSQEEYQEYKLNGEECVIMSQNEVLSIMEEE